MKDYMNTITIPAYAHPNYLAVCLQALIKNSRLKHKIIIVGSKTNEPCVDFVIEPGTLKIYQKYKNMADYLSRNKSFMEENDITYIDCTEEIKEFTKEYRKGNIPTGKAVQQDEIIQDGVFIAFKNNFALQFVETEYVINNWDADFFAAPDWDFRLMQCVEKFKDKKKYMFIPSHVQPIYFDEIPNYSNIWEDFNKISTHRLTIPSSKTVNSVTFVTEGEWYDYVKKWAVDQVIIEKPGDRNSLHWVPILYRTDEFKEHVKAYNYQGSGYDLEIDDRSGKLGFMKICPKDSFILHKGYTCFNYDEM